MDLIHSTTRDVLAVAMDGHSARQKAIASNIANVSTPNYQRRDVSFSGALQQALKGQNIQPMQSNGHIPLNTPHQGGVGMTTNHLAHFNLDAEGNTIRSVQIKPTVDALHQYRNDGNNVDIENEMVQLAKNSGKFGSLTRLQGKLNEQMRQVIRDSAQ